MMKVHTYSWKWLSTVHAWMRFLVCIKPFVTLFFPAFTIVNIKTGPIPFLVIGPISSPILMSVFLIVTSQTGLTPIIPTASRKLGRVVKLDSRFCGLVTAGTFHKLLKTKDLRQSCAMSETHGYDRNTVATLEVSAVIENAPWIESPATSASSARPAVPSM